MHASFWLTVLLFSSATAAAGDATSSRSWGPGMHTGGYGPGWGPGWGQGMPGTGYGPGWCTGTGFEGCPGGLYLEMRDARTPVTAKSDLELIDTLVPHHQRAIEMADIELANGAGAEVKQMAQRMKDDQAAEIQRLLDIRERLTECRELTVYPDPAMDADMEELREQSGDALDRAFLESMIPHHAGALQASHNALRSLQDEELRGIAEEVVREQAREVGEMRAMLDALP